MASLRRGREATSPFDDIIPDLYDAVIKPETWTAVLSRVADVADVLGMHFLSTDSRGQPVFSEMSDRLPTEVNELYRDYYWSVDPRRKLVQDLPVGRFLLDHIHFDEEFVRHDEFYCDYAQPLAGVRYMAGLRLMRDSGFDTLVGFHHRPRQGPFDDRDIRRLQPVLPHLKRAAQIQQRLVVAEATTQAFGGLLDRFQAGVVVVDAQRRVRHCNQAADSLLRAEDGLHVRDRRLLARDGEASRKLGRLIAEAAQCAEGGKPHKGGGEVAIPRRRSRHSLLLLVAPLPEFSAARLWRGEPAVAIYITDPESKPRAPAERLAKMFGLTPAEARLAAWLATGDSLAEAAEIFGVSEYTLRAQMRAIKDKTETRRLAALVRLLSAVAM